MCSLILLTTLLAQTSAVEPSPAKHLTVHREDFAYGARLQIEPDHALQRLVIPADVYDALTRADAGDLAVFNASGAQVPHALQRVSDTLNEVPDVKLPVFPLKAASPEGLGDLQITVERSENGALTTVKSGAQQQTNLVAYLVDASSIDGPMRSLTFKFRDGTDSFVQRLNVDASDDFVDWSSVAYGVTVASLVHEGRRIDKESVEITPVKAKYLRVSWTSNPPPRALEQVIAGVAASTNEPPREWASAREVTTARPGLYRFHLDGFRPVDRVRVHLPEDNSLAEATLASATNTEGGWFTRYGGLVYRLDSSGIGDITISVDDVADPYWQLEVSSTGGGIGSGVPSFEVGWQPHELLFVARGNGPFVLAYGNANNAVASFDPQALATMARKNGGEAIGEATIVDAKVELGGVSKLTPEPPDTTLPVRRIVLWLSLVAAVLLLGWMSIRLFRQLGT